MVERKSFFLFFVFCLLFSYCYLLNNSNPPAKFYPDPKVTTSLSEWMHPQGEMRPLEKIARQNILPWIVAVVVASARRNKIAMHKLTCTHHHILHPHTYIFHDVTHSASVSFMHLNLFHSSSHYCIRVSHIATMRRRDGGRERGKLELGFNSPIHA